MKKTPSKRLSTETDMRAEYDFTGGVRGKHYQALQVGYTIRIHKPDGTVLEKHFESEGTVVLAPDVRRYFPNSKAVNRALRSLIALIPEKRKVAAPKARNRKNGEQNTTKGRTRTMR